MIEKRFKTEGFIMATKKAEDTKKVVKATPADAVAKVEAVKKAEAAKEVAKTVKKAAEPAKEVKAPVEEAKKPAAKKTAAKAAPAKTEAKAEAKKPAAVKKPAAKKPAAVKTTETVYIEYNNGQINVSELAAKAKEAIGNKAVKELNVYYQPETGMVYYTADGESGSYSL
jgi:hypothetical protein